VAHFNVPPDDDPTAAWVAQLNYLAQLCDEVYLRDQVSHGVHSPELERLQAAYRALAAQKPAG